MKSIIAMISLFVMVILLMVKNEKRRSDENNYLYNSHFNSRFDSFICRDRNCECDHYCKASKKTR